MLKTAGTSTLKTVAAYVLPVLIAYVQQLAWKSCQCEIFEVIRLVDEPCRPDHVYILVQRSLQIFSILDNVCHVFIPY